MSDAGLAQLAISLSTFVALVTLFVQLYRESRARKWALEDLKNELKKKADEVKIEMKQTAAVDIAAINGKLTEIKDTIVANGAVKKI